MIFSHIHSQEYSLAAPFQKVLKYLRENDLSQTDVKEIELDGRNIYLQIHDITTQPIAERAAESHTQYLDLQYIILGEEKMGVLPLSTELEVVQKNEEKDFIHYQTNFDNESFLHLKAGDFAIFFPEDVHRPGCQTNNKAEKVRKVVAKIHVDLLN